MKAEGPSQKRDTISANSKAPPCIPMKRGRTGSPGEAPRRMKNRRWGRVPPRRFRPAREQDIQREVPGIQPGEPRLPAKSRYPGHSEYSEPLLRL